MLVSLLMRLCLGTNVLGLADAVNQPVPAVAHDGAHAQEEDAGTEALGGEMALWTRRVSLSGLVIGAGLSCWSWLVDGLAWVGWLPWYDRGPGYAFNQPATRHINRATNLPDPLTEAEAPATHLVLDGLVPAPGGHILRHDGRFGSLSRSGRRAASSGPSIGYLLVGGSKVLAAQTVIGVADLRLIASVEGRRAASD